MRPQTRLVDFRLGRKETVNIRGRHAEIASDIGDRRLAVAVVAKQLFGGIEDPRYVFLTCRIGA